MVHRGVASPLLARERRGLRIGAGRPVRTLATVLAGLLAVTALVLVAGQLTGAQGSEAPRCERFASASHQRAAHPSGRGRDVLVIGDSWSVGLGLRHPARSWPTRLPGRVHVAGFSGSGFSATASSCGRHVDYARRAGGALAVGPDLVVVQGGLNDFDQPTTAVRSGFAQLMRVLQPPTAAYRVVVVGPAAAPSRAAQLPRIDRMLRQLCAEYGVGYVGTADLSLPYLPDRLHLTPAGHRLFGDAVATRIARLPG